MSRNKIEGEYSGWWRGKHRRGHFKDIDAIISCVTLEYNGKFYEMFHEGGGIWSSPELNPPAKLGEVITTHYLLEG